MVTPEGTVPTFRHSGQAMRAGLPGRRGSRAPVCGSPKRSDSLSCITKSPLDRAGGQWGGFVRWMHVDPPGVPLTFTRAGQKRWDRWLGPSVGPKRPLGTARIPGSPLIRQPATSWRLDRDEPSVPQIANPRRAHGTIWFPLLMDGQRSVDLIMTGARSFPSIW